MSDTPKTDAWCELAINADVGAVLELAKSFERENAALESCLKVAKADTEAALNSFHAMRLERDELKEQMVGLRREIEHQKNRVVAYEQQLKEANASHGKTLLMCENRIKELEVPICIGQPIITILAETGEWRSEDGRGVIAASDLFHNNPYDELAVHRATETCSQCKRPWNPSYVESGWCMSCIIKERDEQLESLRTTLESTQTLYGICIKERDELAKFKQATMFPAALCQKCSCDGDLYHATINRYPLGTTFRCPLCITLFTPSPQ